MTRLVGFAGSLRQASFNRALINAAPGLMPDGAALEVLSIDDVPLYNADVENDAGIPLAVSRMKSAIEFADGLVIATPEYNNGIPGVAKNVIDWVSRPADDQAKVLHGKPVALIGASPGRLGTVSAQTAWLPVLRTLRMRLWVGGGPFIVPSAAASIQDGSITNAELSERLAAYLAAFVASIAAT
jgi:NAD(P)H-dependent FMN reductase